MSPAPDHGDHRLVGSRHDLGDPHHRADLPTRGRPRRHRRGRRLPPLRPRRMQRAIAEAERAGQPALQPLRPRGQPARRARAAVRDLRRNRHRRGPRVPPRRRRDRGVGQEPGTFSDVAADCPTAPTCCSTRACTAATSTTRSTSRGTPTCWSASCRSSTSSGSRRCTATGPRAATATRRSSRHDPAPDARLHEHICPQFSRTDVNFQRVPRSTPRTRSSRAHPDRRREHCSSSGSATRTASTSPTCCRCCTTRSCRGRTRSSCPAGRWSWRCS